ncbi:MAG: hypothetical protein L0J08_12625 [Micrococcaceae bacterium]|nr:hypothetical protein [Micrococcaceae bacterium]
MADDNARSPRDRAADEAAWQDLVSRLDDVGMDVDPEAEAADPPGPTPDPRDEPGPLRRPAGGPRDYELLEEPEEDWTPEDPPALGSGNPLTVLAWTCAAGAPIALVLLAILGRAAPRGGWRTLCVAFVAAAGYLAFRLPRHRQDGDNGARV